MSKRSITIGRSMRKLEGVIVALCVLFTLLYTALETNAFNMRYWENYQAHFDIVAKTGKSEAEVKSASEDLARYLKTGEDALMEKHFNARECAHMKDVYALFKLGRTLRLVAIGIVLVAVIRKRLTKRTFLFGLYVWDAVILVLGVLITTNFSRAFILFHKLFFTNDLWLLNPETDWMIRLLPESFFAGIALRTAISFLVGLLLTHALTIFRKEKQA